MRVLFPLVAHKPAHLNRAVTGSACPFLKFTSVGHVYNMCMGAIVPPGARFPDSKI